MVEYVNPQEENQREGHQPNTNHLVLELHRLLALFLASKSFAALRTGIPGESYDPIYGIQEVEEDELTRLLLTLAITARVIDDRDGRILEKYSTSCGTLCKDVTKGQTEPLNLREACNKIIHAIRMRLDFEDLDGQHYLAPTVFLYATGQANEGWKATLDVVEFAKEYFSLVCYL